MFKSVRIETERLIIRPFGLDHVEAFQAILSQEEVMRFLPENVMTVDEVREIVEWYQKTYEANRPDKVLKWTLAVWLKEKMDSRVRGNDDKIGSSAIIGWAGIGEWDPDPTETELYYGIASEYWGQGYATEAAQAVMEYAFNVIGLKRLIAVVNPDNISSVRVVEKLGMRLEKTLTGLPAEFSNDEGSGFWVKETA